MIGLSVGVAGAVLVLAFFLTVVGTLLYKRIAVRRGILANPNFRSLHEHPIPRGGGIVFSLVCVAAGAALLLAVPDLMPPQMAYALLLGGAAASLFGFADDIYDLPAETKLLAQGMLGAWTLFCFGGQPLVDVPWMPALVDLGLSWLALVWLLNLYNFMDGVDGMAASGAAFISLAAVAILFVAGAASGLVVLLGLLAVCSLGFLVFNWPRASIFMGDSGSLFLGYSFGVLITGTGGAGQISRWTWLIIFGYFAIDTTTTTLLRIFVTKKWYGAHRSHAYQNLARIRGSHLRVVTEVTLYHVLWLLPLALWSTLVPSWAPLAAALAVVPVVLWTLRYGPMLSSS